MIKSTFSALLLLLSVAAFATDSALWLRKHSISPDGTQIAFAYQGDIFVVSAQGGQARQVTSHPAYESDPLWSADGKYIIFSSLREGSKDIYYTSVEGGIPTRVSYYAGNEVPIAALPNGDILFQANIQFDSLYSGFPNTQQLYSIPLQGGKVQHITSLPIMSLSINSQGDIIYEDYKGREDNFRKHHTSSVTRDIWLYQAKDGKLSINSEGQFTKLSDFAGEDRNPVFAANGRDYYFLSERSGSFNIYKSNIYDSSKLTAITSLNTHPVRYMSVSRDGLISFSYDGSLYTVREGQQPKRLNIIVKRDPAEKVISYTSVSLGISSVSVSPNGKEVAIVARGDVYVCAIDAGITNRITNTPVQERGVSFSADGRTLYYASERDGHWGIYSSSLVDKEDKYFSLAYKFEEKLFSSQGQTCFAPSVSPDGEWLAMLRDRTELVIKNIKTGKEKSLIKAVNYSYVDGDISFEWSPDSKRILSNWQSNGGWRYEDVALVDIEDGSIVNLTESGYADYNFNWGLGGKAMTWSSDKAGYRSHGGSGSQRDIYLMFFDDKAFADYNRRGVDEEIHKMLTEDDKKAKKDEKKDSTKVKKLNLELEGRYDRVVRVTNTSGSVGAAYLNKEGTKLYYVAGGDLYVKDIKKGDSKVLAKGVSGAMELSKDGKYAYFATRLGVTRCDLNSGSKKNISFRGEYDYRPAEERAYIFEHCWKQVAEKFYDPDIHGLDWAMYKEAYAKFLPYISNNYDFSELLSEMLGELNASHTGARYRSTGGLSSGKLGIIWDTDYQGDGLLIKEIIKGGQMAIALPEIKVGDVIEAIDGKKIIAGTDWLDLLRSTGGKRILLTIRQGKKSRDYYFTPASSDTDLLYKRWVARNEALVAELSNGQVGYVHVKDMDTQSFREVYSKMLGKYRTAKAIIVDTRHNGGGWLHEDLVTLLSGKPYLRFEPRGQYAATEPVGKWSKPSCVLMSEDNYSDASGFPYAYKTLGLGKLIGMPVPGTMTAVWWENQIDPTLRFGIPQVGTVGIKEGRYLENLQVEPDILVDNDPASLLRGEDKQLEAAVKEMLKACL